LIFLFSELIFKANNRGIYRWVNFKIGPKVGKRGNKVDCR